MKIKEEFSVLYRYKRVPAMYMNIVMGIKTTSFQEVRYADIERGGQ